MPDTVSRPGWWSEIQRRARERDIERQVMYDRTRKATVRIYLAARALGRFPALLPEYLKVLLGSMIGFWLLAWPLSKFFDAQRVYTYAVLALVFSLQATYYKHQLAKNPEYKVRRCNCGGARKDGTETVLKSSASTIVGIPNSLLGAAIYGVLLVSIYSGSMGTAQLVAAAGVLVSAYLAFVMIVRVGALCSTCISIAALNVLIVWQLLR
jgi:uncharacterized membrane protein